MLLKNHSLLKNTKLYYKNVITVDFFLNHSQPNQNRIKYAMPLLEQKPARGKRTTVRYAFRAMRVSTIVGGGALLEWKKPHVD